MASDEVIDIKDVFAVDWNGCIHVLQAYPPEGIDIEGSGIRKYIFHSDLMNVLVPSKSEYGVDAILSPVGDVYVIDDNLRFWLKRSNGDILDEESLGKKLPRFWDWVSGSKSISTGRRFLAVGGGAFGGIYLYSYEGALIREINNVFFNGQTVSIPVSPDGCIFVDSRDHVWASWACEVPESGGHGVLIAGFNRLGETIYSRLLFDYSLLDWMGVDGKSRMVSWLMGNSGDRINTFFVGEKLGGGV